MGENEGMMLDQTYEDETACFDAMFAGVRLSSLLTSCSHDQFPFSLPEYAVGESSSSANFPAIPSLSEPATFCFFSEEFPALSSEKKPLLTTTTGCSSSYSVDFMAEKQLGMAKCEPLVGAEMFGGYQLESVVPTLGDYYPYLPDLQSLKVPVPVPVPVPFAEVSPSSSSRKRVRRRRLPECSYSTEATSDYTLDAIVRSFKPSWMTTDSVPRSLVPAMEIPISKARKRREKFGEKARCLQKLMPWKKKMNMATLLEEAHKYVMFLQAQVSVLKMMSCDSSFSVQQQQNPSHGCGYELCGGLEMLNRQELLQALVSSPVAQRMMYSQGCCVFSIEQFVLLKKMVQRKLLMQQQQQFMFDP